MNGFQKIEDILSRHDEFLVNKTEVARYKKKARIAAGVVASGFITNVGIIAFVDIPSITSAPLMIAMVGMSVVFGGIGYGTDQLDKIEQANQNKGLLENVTKKIHLLQRVDSSLCLDALVSRIESESVTPHNRSFWKTIDKHLDDALETYSKPVVRDGNTLDELTVEEKVPVHFGSTRVKEFFL